MHPYAPVISINPNLDNDSLGQVMVQQSSSSALAPADSQPLKLASRERKIVYQPVTLDADTYESLMKVGKEGVLNMDVSFGQFASSPAKSQTIGFGAKEV